MPLPASQATVTIVYNSNCMQSTSEQMEEQHIRRIVLARTMMRTTMRMMMMRTMTMMRTMRTTVPSCAVPSLPCSGSTTEIISGRTARGEIVRGGQRSSLWKSGWDPCSTKYDETIEAVEAV